jgi:serine/threonine-protein kinase RsbW
VRVCAAKITGTEAHETPRLDGLGACAVAAASIMESRASPCVLDLPAVPSSVSKARAAMVRYGVGCGADRDDVAIGTSEAVTNAVKHAYPDSEQGSIRVCAARKGDVLVIIVRDDGVGMRPARANRGLGMGLFLIDSVADSVTIETAGDNVGVAVSMRFPCTTGPKSG